MKCNILVIGNEVHVAQEIQGILEKQGAFIEVAYNGQHGITNAQNNIYDLIILDPTLPQMSGLDVLQNLSQEKTQAPILMLISKNQIGELASYFEHGARDYIMKPITVKELLDKTKILLGIKKQQEITKPITYGDIELNLEEKMISRKEESVTLQKKEYQIMALLIYSPGQIFSKQLIIEKFWGERSGLEDNNIEVHISLLRKKLQSIGAKVKIRTVRGVGYALTMSE